MIQLIRATPIFTGVTCALSHIPTPSPTLGRCWSVPCGMVLHSGGRSTAAGAGGIPRSAASTPGSGGCRKPMGDTPGEWEGGDGALSVGQGLPNPCCCSKGWDDAFGHAVGSESGV